MYEHKTSPLLPRRVFLRRVAAHGGAALLLILVSLAVGIACYHAIAGLPWVDSLLNASMILGGMGPVDALRTPGAKVFASLYALYSGLVLLVSVGILAAPVFHRMLHRFHLETPGRN